MIKIALIERRAGKRKQKIKIMTEQQIEEIKRKANAGDAEAQYELGLWYLGYYVSEFVPQDDMEAAKWFRKAAEQGHAKAQYSLGLMYDEDNSLGPRDYVEAAKWFRKASEQEHAGAQYNLGLMHDEGKGMPKNSIEAYAWYLLAKANGNEESSKKIFSLEERLTAEQIEKGEARAMELKRLIDAKRSIIPESKPSDDGKGTDNYKRTDDSLLLK